MDAHICLDCQTKGAPQEKPAAPLSFAAKGVILGCAVTAATVLAAPLVLGAVGFSSAGIVAGTTAAAWQGAAVVPGSLFALAQSFAAGGCFSALGGATVVAAGTGMGGIVGTAVDAARNGHPAPAPAVCLLCGRPLP